MIRQHINREFSFHRTLTGKSRFFILLFYVFFLRLPLPCLTHRRKLFFLIFFSNFFFFYGKLFFSYLCTFSRLFFRTLILVIRLELFIFRHLKLGLFFSKVPIDIIHDLALFTTLSIFFVSIKLSFFTGKFRFFHF
jgi:hypothetical protein